MCSHRKLSESDLKDTITTELREKMKGGRKNKPECALELMDPGPAPPLQSLHSPLLCPNPEKPFHLERKKGQRDHSPYPCPPLPRNRLEAAKWHIQQSDSEVDLGCASRLQSVFSELRPVPQASRDGGHSRMSNNRVYGKH